MKFSRFEVALFASAGQLFYFLPFSKLNLAQSIFLVLIEVCLALAVWHVYKQKKGDE